MNSHRILVVEDNPISLKMMRLTLESAGYEVATATDGRTALVQAGADTAVGDARNQVHLVLLDLLLPDIDGLELAKQLHKIPGNASLPIVAMSGLESKLEAAGRAGAGFCAHLLKPVEPAEILAAVEKHVVKAPESSQPTKGWSVLVADDDPIQRKLTGLHLTRAGLDVAYAADGAEALDTARRSRPDAIVSDILMPRMDGFQLCWSVRSDPHLARVPVILLTSSYVEDRDHKLGLDVGATAFLPRTPDMKAIVQKLLLLLGQQESAATAEHTAASDVREAPDTPPAALARVVRSVSDEHRASLTRQLERQVDTAALLAREAAIQGAQLAILGGLSEVLARTSDVQEILMELLARCLESSGFTSGAVYLANPDDILELRAHAGFPAHASRELEDFFGHAPWLNQVRLEGEPVALPAHTTQEIDPAVLLPRAGARSLFLMPLVSGGSRLGVMVLGADTDQVSGDAISFVQTLRGQISQAVALGQSLTALAASEKQFRTISESAAEGIIQTAPDGSITYVNKASERLFDYEAERVIGRPLTLILPLLPGRPGSWETEGVTLEGRRIPLQGTTRTGTDRWGRACYTHIFRDLTERRMYETRLIEFANRDALTGVFNRRRFLDELQRYVAQSRRYDLAGALLLLDLDKLNEINERYGHQIGDMVLSTTAKTLTESFREHDVVARVGDDEFAVLLPYMSSEQAGEATKRAREHLAEQWRRFPDSPFHIDVSTGIVHITSEIEDGETLMSRAEYALRRAKGSAGRTWTYDPNDVGPVAESDDFRWEARIHDALANDKFRLVFQPVQRVRERTCWGYEALLRMVGDSGEEILPGEFLSVAERTKLITDIDRWVVQRSVEMLPALLSDGPERTLEINLSGRAFESPELLAFIHDAVKESGVPPASLCFEITESAAISNLLEAQEFITELRRLGCRFALDDFGVGFSSFQYLKHLAVDLIKIDGSFIRDLPRSATDQHLVRAIIAVAHGLGKQTVAEFVGDQETLALLGEYGVDLAQGYYIGRPGVLAN